jgi:hypothetical protein
MLKRFADLRGRPVRAQDGAGGWLDDLLFDDRDGSVRHVVLKIGRWRHSRRVWLVAESLSVNHNGELRVEMTRAEVRCAAHPDSCPPSASQSLQHGDCYGGVGNDNSFARESEELEQTPFDAMLAYNESNANHQRSVREVIGYKVLLGDGSAGEVVDVWLDTATWQVAHFSLDLPFTKRPKEVPVRLTHDISGAERTMRLSAYWSEKSEKLVGACLSRREVFSSCQGVVTP